MKICNKNKLIQSFVSVVLSLCMVFSFSSFFVCSAESLPSRFKLGETTTSIGTVYYVDNVNGNDENVGTSEKNSWKTLNKVNATTFHSGDKLLFKRGGNWSGQLWPKGSGTMDAPIKIESYGNKEDALPLIHGDSWCGSNGDNLDKNIFNAAVYFYNQQYWEINELEVTNQKPGEDPPTNLSSPSGDQTIRKFGILIMAKDAGTLNHMYVQNCNVHNVVSYTGSSAGIGRGAVVYAIRGNKIPTNWNDIVIENNQIGPKVNHYGISFISTWGSSLFPNESGITEPGGESRSNSTNILIRNNYCIDVGNAAICPTAYTNALIEHNVCDTCNSGLNGNVPIWWENGDYTVAQYNEVFNSGASMGKEDSQAFDADVNARLNYIQYNYTHDNPSGAFFECALGTVYETHIRYNISQNDGAGINRFGQGSIVTIGGNSGNVASKLFVYNNTFFIDKYNGQPCQSYVLNTWGEYFNPTKLDNFQFKNNVVINNSSDNPFSTFTDGNNKGKLRLIGRFSNNAYGGLKVKTMYPSEVGTPSYREEQNSIFSDQLPNGSDVNFGIKAPGTGGSSEISKQTSMGTIKDIRELCSGYKISENSPLIGSGTIVAENGGQDFFGNPVSSTKAPNIGADNSYADNTQEELPENIVQLNFNDKSNGALNGDYNGFNFGENVWNVSAEDELYASDLCENNQATKIAVPNGMVFTGFKAHTESTALVQLVCGNVCKNFNISSTTQNYSTGLKQSSGAVYLVITSPNGASKVKFDDLTFIKPNESLANVALGKKTSQNTGINAASKAVDGDMSTFSGNADFGTNNPYILTVDLNKKYKAKRFEVEFEHKTPGQDGIANDWIPDWKYKVEYTSDGSTWKTLVDYTKTNSNTVPLQVVNQEFDCLSIRITLTGKPSKQPFAWAAVPELRVFSEVDTSIEQGQTINNNIAFNKPVKASSNNDNCTPSAITDNDFNTVWMASNNDKNPCARIDLGRAYTLTGAILSFTDDNMNKSYTIDASNDGITWKTVINKSGEDNSENHVLDVINNVTAQYVRVTTKDSQLAISEFKLFGSQAKRDSKNVLVLVPHEDDEVIMTGGVIRDAVLNGDSVKVAIVTNGDYNGQAAADKRIGESLSALASLGLHSDDVYFYGFADLGGMAGQWGQHFYDSQLYKLYYNTDPNAVVPSKWGNNTMTYGQSLGGKQDYAYERWGTHLKYTRNNLLKNIIATIEETYPEDIYVTSMYDIHGDHGMTNLFLREAILKVKENAPNYSPTIHEGIVHSVATDDFWPIVNKNAAAPLTMPDYFEERSNYNWDERESLTTPYEMRQSAPFEYSLKDKAMHCYKSQYMDFVAAFTKHDEMFFKEKMNSISYSAKVTASSSKQNMTTNANYIYGKNIPQNVIDGVASGSIPALSANDNHPGFPSAEWVSNGTKNEWVQLDWNSSKTLNKVVLYDRPDPDQNITSGKLIFSDGSEVDVGALPTTGRPLEITFEPKVSTYVKFVVTGVSDSTTSAGLAEFKVFDKEVLTTDKEVYKLGEKIKVNYCDAVGDSWVGIYPKGGVPSASVVSLDWRYTKDQSNPNGSIVFDPNKPWIASLSPWGKTGEYEAIMFTDGGYTIKERKAFKIVNYLSVDKSIYKMGEKVSVSYSEATGDSWVGIYHKGTIPSAIDVSLDWKYTKDKTQPNGTIIFDPNRTWVTQLSPWGKVGEYEAILFSDGGYTVKARAPFTIINEDVVLCKPSAVTYDKSSPISGYADGIIKISPATDESVLSQYVLYWGNDNGKLADYTPIATLPKTGKEINYSVVNNTIIPKDATKILAYSAKDSLESAEYAITDINKNSAIYAETPLNKFEVLSDVHINASSTDVHTKHFDNALKDIKNIAGDSSAIIIVGDNTNQGTAEQYDQMNKTINENKDGLPKIYHALGNHDLYVGRDWQTQVNLFKDKTGMPDYHFSKTINNSKFIFLASQAVGRQADIRPDQMQWLESELAQSPKNQPVFLFLHQSLYNTVAGSLPGQEWNDVKQDTELREVLKKYPQTVFFTGHSHWELESKSTMYDGKGKEATMFNDASCGYLWTDTSDPNSDGKVGSQGYYVEVYKDKILVKGRDFLNHKWVSSAQFVVRLSIDKKELNSLIEKAEELQKQSNTYTSESLINLQKELTVAKQLAENENMWQVDIDNAKDALLTAVNSLAFQKPDVKPTTPTNSYSSSKDKIMFATDTNKSGIAIEVETGVTNVVNPLLTTNELPNWSLTVKEFKASAKDYSLIKTFIINLYDSTTKVTKVEGGKIKVEIPFAGTEDKEYIVLRYNDDKTITELKATFKDGKLVFETDHFSTYAIAMKANITSAVSNSTVIKPVYTKVPKTFDASPIATVVLLIAIADGMLLTRRKFCKK